MPRRAYGFADPLSLAVSEVVPIKARFFLRQALGLYKDIHSVDDLADEELRSLKKAIGPALYVRQFSLDQRLPFLIRLSTGIRRPHCCLQVINRSHALIAVT